MERLPLTLSDKIWLQENYPGLYFDSNEQIIIGKLYFKMYYSVHERGYVLNPDSSYESKNGIIIEDVYEMEIDLSKQGFLPPVRETGGRILRSKEKWNVEQLIDMHVYPNGTACLCIRTEEQLKMPNGFSLKDFFENLLIPYFYYQSFFEKSGKEPWKGYSHGDLGILESYLCQKNSSPGLLRLFLDNLSDGLQRCLINNIQLKGYQLCICQSKRKFRKCHRDAFLGYNKLRVDFKRWR
jgi:hypothetical protein